MYFQIGRFVECIPMLNNFHIFLPSATDQITSQFFFKIIVWGGCQDIVETEVIASSQNGKKAMLLGCIWRENPNSVENLGGFPGRKRAASRTP